MGKAIIIFDGLCNLCTGSIIFIIKRDPRAFFSFAAFQNEGGRKLLEDFGLTPDEMTSIALIEEDRLYTRSTAVLRIVRKLRAPWPVLYAFFIIPKFIRDPLYDWVARKRYRWFGQLDQCFMPSEELNSRFVN